MSGSPLPAPLPKHSTSRAFAVAELLLVGLIFEADYFHWHHLIIISKTPYLFALGWMSIRLRGQTWKSLGMTLHRTWGRTLLLGVLFGIGNEVLELFVTQPLLVRWFHRWPDLSDLRPLVGNSSLLAVALTLTWTLAAFGEEMVYRGYLMNRIADLLGHSRGAWAASLVVTSVLFGFGHFDQGAVGQIENIAGGLLLGIFYLACGRNLAVPVVAHGIQDSIDVLLIFFNKYPGGL